MTTFHNRQCNDIVSTHSRGRNARTHILLTARSGSTEWPGFATHSLLSRKHQLLSSSANQYRSEHLLQKVQPLLLSDPVASLDRAYTSILRTIASSCRILEMIWRRACAFPTGNPQPLVCLDQGVLRSMLVMQAGKAFKSDFR